MQLNMDTGTYLQSIREENSALVYNNKNIYEADTASDLVLTKLLQHFTFFFFFSESSILFGKLKLSIFVSTSYCINTVNLCFNFHQGLIKMLQKFCSV